MGCVRALETALAATGMRLLAVSDTPFLTTMLRMNCICMNVHGHVVFTFTMQEAAGDFFFFLQSGTSSIFLTFLCWYTGNDIEFGGQT